MTAPLHHPHEPASDAARDQVAQLEPRSLRTYTPTQAVLARAAGIYHWTPEGRRLYDFSSGVLVANLGHNPTAWMERFTTSMGWNGTPWQGGRAASNGHPAGFFSALPLTA